MAGQSPHMAEGASRTVRQAQRADWEEDSLLRLYLTTLAGTVIQLQVPVSIYHTWEMLEEYLVEHLPCISPIETFGCELTLLNADTQVALQDPVQEELWNTNHFCLIVHECFRSWRTTSPSRGLIMKTARRRFESLSLNQVFLKPRPSTRPRESATPA